MFSGRQVVCYTSDPYHLCMYSRSDSIIGSDSGWWGPSLCCWHLKQGQTECTASQLQPVTWELIYNPFQWISPWSESAESTPALVPHVPFTLMKHSHEHMYFLQSTRIFILKTQSNPCDTAMLITWKPKATEHVSSPSIQAELVWKASVVFTPLWFFMHSQRIYSE